MSGRYVALGSSMAAGPGIRPTAAGAPFRAGRSARNYAHLVAEKLFLDLVDVTYSGATTANVLTDFQHGQPPQVEGLDGSETLVTVTIGGNDVGYVPMLMVAGLPRFFRSVPLLGALLREQLNPAARDRALLGVAESLKEVGRTVRQRAPQARVCSSTTSPCCRRREPRHRRFRMSTSRSGAAPPTPWNGSPARQRPKRAASGCAPRRPAASTTPGRPNPGPQNSVCRCRADLRRCIQTRPGCASSPTWLPRRRPEIMGR